MISGCRDASASPSFHTFVAWTCTTERLVIVGMSTATATSWLVEVISDVASAKGVASDESVVTVVACVPKLPLVPLPCEGSATVNDPRTV